MLQLLNLETVGTNQWMGLQLEGSCVYMLLTFQYSGHLIMSSIVSHADTWHFYIDLSMMARVAGLAQL